MGRFTSPHLYSYFERITINEYEIEPSILMDYLYNVKNHAKSLEDEGHEYPTEFEILTAIALKCFKDYKVDIAILEVGMGGIYDSTNVIESPLVSVITSIGCDHTQYLGDTLKEIAHNKAGIIKTNVPVVTGEINDDALSVIRKRATQLNARLFHANEIKIKLLKPPDLSGFTIDIKGLSINIESVKISLLGDFQLTNISVSILVLEILKNNGYKITNEIIAKTFPSLKHPGRLEIVSNNPLVIVDVAHNPQGSQALARSLETLLPNKKKVLVCGFLDDKDIQENLKPLGNKTKICIITKPKSHRSSNWHNIAFIWQQEFPHIKFIVEENIQRAVEKGFSLVGTGEYLLIAGSFYLLSEARQLFVQN
ncbi:Dihydrofolate synthase [Candidatus Syntrophocurvum alkaliphilum]|uniref:tetrahydrofolate synthase n=1 Tax=Candidatus Syntrophocurvum alkaliphilum TaxID=2293317 RepID=A0A6I6DBP5_9FIRM|nr:Dihydrofolate synthase [Candidatus Syntrophocurvum alkaliphilum]